MSPSEFARLADYSRQHLLRVRMGAIPGRKLRTASIRALERATGEEIPEETVFEPAGVSVMTLLPKHAVQRKRSKTETKRHKHVRVAARMLDDEVIEGWLARISATPNSHTEASTRDLLDQARELLDIRPTGAEQLYRGAYQLAEHLRHSPPHLVSALRGYSLKGRANALRMLGRFDDAITVLAAAEFQFRASQYCVQQIAEVRYTRATIYLHLERLREASEDASMAGKLFSRERDAAGKLRARFLEAVIFDQQGRTEESREIFLSLRKQIEGRGDRELLARLWLNLGVCDMRRGTVATARHWLSRAQRGFRSLQMRTELVRVRWCDARVDFIDGLRDRGITVLRKVIDDFGKLDMQADAAFAGLDLLAELIKDQDRNEEARLVARDALARFQATGIRRSAVIALEFLREAVSKEEADTRLIDYIAKYVRRSEFCEDESFAPPQTASG